MSIEALFSPESVAVIGSASEGKLANILINRLLSAGAKKVFAINPKAVSVGKAKGYSSLDEVEEEVEMAVIASPASTVVSVMRQAGEKGVKAAVIITSGFSEAGNKKDEEEIAAIARQYGIRFIGPNCAGLANPHADLAPTLETLPKKGSIAVVSQSGAIGGAFMALCEADGTGISKFASFGNGADVSAIALLDYLKDDRQTKVIALYLESVTDGRGFMDAVKAAVLKKPVVVVKSGRTSTGQRAALSHTGSMAGSDSVFSAAMKQCGAIRAESLEEMFLLCKGFAMLPEISGNKMAIVTNSGGPGVLTSDKADELGLSVAETEGEIKKDLAEFLPPHAGLHNPIDLTVEGTGDEYEKALDISLRSYDCAVAIYVGTPYLKAMPVAKGIVNVYNRSRKSIAAVLLVGSDLTESLAYLQEHGVPCFSSGEQAAEVFSKIRLYTKAVSDKSLDEDRDVIAEKGKAFQHGPLLEPYAMALLKEQNIPVPKFAHVTDRNKLEESAKEIGYPLAMKVVSPQIIHKTDAGGVLLNVKDPADVKEGFRHFERICEGKEFKGTVLYPMLDQGIEVIIGLTKDTAFGPVVAFGLGGVYTEVLGDIVLKIAPVSKADALKMIKEIRAFPLLKGVRGQKGADLDKLAQAISNFSKLPFIYPDIKEADLNPVFAYPDRITVADCRILGE